MKQWPVKALFGKLLKVNHIFIMKRRIILCAAVLMAAVANTFACTNLIVGKNASADGSTIVSYSADSYGLFGELYHYPAATYPKGTMLKVYEWDTGKYLGEIEQARQYGRRGGELFNHAVYGVGGQHRHHGLRKPDLRGTAAFAHCP